MKKRAKIFFQIFSVVGATCLLDRSFTLYQVERKNPDFKPHPDGRLGAFEATRGFPPDTCGQVFHRVIGIFYLGFGPHWQLNIGQLFRQPLVQNLLKDPITSKSNLTLAEIESTFWVSHKDTFGGKLGSTFGPKLRGVIQYRIFYKDFNKAEEVAEKFEEKLESEAKEEELK